MKRVIRKILFLTIALIFSSSIFAQSDLIKVADGREEIESPKASESETEFVEKEVKAKEQAIKDYAKRKEFKCDEDDAKLNLSNENVTANLSIDAVLKGSFTKPKSSQKAFFYQICWSDGGKYATSLGGIIVVEDQKTVAHFVYADVSGFDTIRVLPDINRNGLSEVVLRFTSKIDGLMIGRSIALFEIGADKITNLGETETYNMLEDETLAYKTVVKAGKTPVFYQEIYTDIPDAEKENWRIKEKLKRFTLDQPEKSFEFVKLSAKP